ncbi:MAG TPA: ABC transporter substrate-binding protein, partial [Candidatus Sulfotelmatobacter sp.]|nr:ABC transporter substrate-binding protein [Candidatus Sulfotelmatobacter sp.]
GSRLGRVRRFVQGGVFLLVLFVVQACHKASQPAPATTIILIDQARSSRDYQRRLDEELAEFTRQTGIRVEFLPAPETAEEQLATWQKFLEGGPKAPDVYSVDVIWPTILADNLLDLKLYIPEQEVQAHFPELIGNYTVNGRLVALPVNLSEGMLFYRVDLLREYGYRAPPKTWEELEVMARRIQAGERAKGNKDFWGFVWEGAPSEALTCNALEWQVSEGGGAILDENGKVTVNNPKAIRAWDRAARWVGSISPPGVVEYKEWDAGNMWQAGKAAFLRSWASEYIADRAPGSLIRDRVGVAPLPSGAAGMAATLGGYGLGVSRHSLHPREAAMLVRFLCSREQQAERSRNTSEAPSLPELYGDPEVLASNPQLPQVLKAFPAGAVFRPSRAAGKMYPEVSRSYSGAVHAVLTRKKSGAQAAADLQDELQRMLRMPAVRASANLDKSVAHR